MHVISSKSQVALGAGPYLRFSVLKGWESSTPPERVTYPSHVSSQHTLVLITYPGRMESRVSFKSRRQSWRSNRGPYGRKAEILPIDHFTVTESNLASSWNRGEGWLGLVREVKIIIIRKKLISMSIISTSLTVRGQLSSRIHVEAWLPFRNCKWSVALPLNRFCRLIFEIVFL